MLKKISISLLTIVILLTTGFFIYRHFDNKKVEGIQDANSKIIGIPIESKNKPSPLKSSSQSPNQNNLVSENKNQNNTSNSTPSSTASETNDSDNDFTVPNYPIPSYSDDYTNSLINRAQEEAQKSHESLQKAEDCFAFQAQKDAEFLPLKQAISELWNQYYNADKIVAERTRGTDVNESQRLRLVEAEKQKIKADIDQFQAEYNRLYSNYGECNY
ncbi:MAG: hypothetical protein WCV58_00770 [Patescibacteria group bacterium]